MFLPVDGALASKGRKSARSSRNGERKIVQKQLRMMLMTMVGKVELPEFRPPLGGNHAAFNNIHRTIASSLLKEMEPSDPLRCFLSIVPAV